MTEERKNLLDRIIKNAQVLGRMSGNVEKWEKKPWLIDDGYKEVTIRRFYEIRREQEELLRQLRGCGGMADT